MGIKGIKMKTLPKPIDRHTEEIRLRCVELALQTHAAHSSSKDLVDTAKQIEDYLTK